MLVGVLISLGVRRCFGFKFPISWCWDAYHSCSVLYSSGCCNASCNTLLETTKNGCAVLSWVWVPPPTHTYLGACVRKDMNAQAYTHFRGILYFPQLYPTCQRRLLIVVLPQARWLACKTFYISLFFGTKRLFIGVMPRILSLLNIHR